MSIRPVHKVIKSKPTMEGAGVHLRRAFGFGNTTDFDPFLLLDDFRNDIPADYLAGFPWHPHRGIETITYVLAGNVEHADSIGNHGSIEAGDIQWMTAGRGIIHQEMPKGDQSGRMHGFQLWANLPSSLKMTAPHYQEVKAPEIASVTEDDGTQARIICGTFWGKRAPSPASPPTRSTSTSPFRPANANACPSTPPATPSPTSSPAPANSATPPAPWPSPPKASTGSTPPRPPKPTTVSLILFDSGDEVVVQAGDQGIRFLLVSGKPLKEPVAWYGPIVMNTQEQLRKAFDQLNEGTFLESESPK